MADTGSERLCSTAAQVAAEPRPAADPPVDRGSLVPGPPAADAAGSPPRHSDPRPGHGACWLSARGVSGPPCAAPRSGGPRGRRRPSLCFQQLRRDLQLRGCAVPSSRTLRGPPLFSGCSLPWQSRLPWSPRLSDLFEGVRDGFKFSPCTDSVRRNTVIFSVFPYFIIVTFTISKLKLKRTKIFRK